MPIRTSIKAIINQDDHILFIKKKSKTGFYYLLPGGGQEHGESMEAALIRECQEEVAVDIRVGEVLLVRDYIGKNHSTEAAYQDFHQVEIMFACNIMNGQKPQNGLQPDPGQVGVEWISIQEMDSHAIYPCDLKRFLTERQKEGKIYVGDVN